MTNQTERDRRATERDRHTTESRRNATEPRLNLSDIRKRSNRMKIQRSEMANGTSTRSLVLSCLVLAKKGAIGNKVARGVRALSLLDSDSCTRPSMRGTWGYS